MSPNESQREPLDLLAEEFAERWRKGEQPSSSEYEARYPDLAGQIRALFPAVAVMEQFKHLRKPFYKESVAGNLPVQLGDFRLLREIGRGGMGIVYEAVQESLGRVVALKVLSKHGMLDPKRRDRFQREAQAAARLHHKNIVPVFAVGEVDGLPYYAMQFIRGKSWAELVTLWNSDMSHERKAPTASTLTSVANENTLPLGQIASPDQGTERLGSKQLLGPLTQVAQMGIQAAQALDHAHQRGILHRDIKPSNFLVDDHGTVWVTDFGLAKLVGLETLTSTGDVIGTLSYMAPENFQGRADARSDVYSLGLTLYELATLQPAFCETDPAKLIKQVSEREPARPSAVSPLIPHDLETIILKAIARDPEHRYQTAKELAEDLQRFLEDRPIQAQRLTRRARLGRWWRRNRLANLAIGVCLLAAVISVAGYLRSRAALAEAETVRAAEKKKNADEVVQALAELCLARLTLADLLQRYGQEEKADSVRRQAIALAHDPRLAAALADNSAARFSHPFAELAAKLNQLNEAHNTQKLSEKPSR